jgi:hypothetical protein
VRKRTTCRLRCTTVTMIRPRAQAHDMPVALHNGNDNNNSGDEDNEVNEYHHTLCASAPGFKPLCASAPGFSAIVRKCTSYSVKHRHNNQLETSNIDNQCHEDNKSMRTTLCTSAPGISAIVRKRTSFQPSCASARATASAMGLHKLFCIPRASKKA